MTGLNFAISDNLRQLRPEDEKLGRALMEFGRMIEDGRALGFSNLCVTPSNFPLRNLGQEYQSWSAQRARLSIERAKRQYEKGNLTLAEYDEIIQRCHAALKGGEK